MDLLKIGIGVVFAIWVFVSVLPRIDASSMSSSFNGNFYFHCTKNDISIKDFFSKCDQTAGNCGFFFSILYFTSMYNVHLKTYNSSINNMFTH